MTLSFTLSAPPQRGGVMPLQKTPFDYFLY